MRASQHVAGITGVKNVVAVNKDKDADIFKVSRYGAVADWKPFLIAFIEERMAVSKASVHAASAPIADAPYLAPSRNR